MRLDIIYEDRRGASCVECNVDREKFYDRLKELRRRGVKFAEVWSVDENEVRIDIEGGIEEMDGADDQRIKYNVWAWRQD